MSKTIGGALVGRALKAYGDKVVIPPLPKLDIGEIQQETTAGNIAALPGAEQLGAGVDQYNFDQLRKALEFWSPGSLAQVNKNIGEQLRGEFDATGAIRSATAAGYGKGFGPSFGSRYGIGTNLTLKTLGLESMATQQRGLSNLLALKQAGPPAFDISSQFASFGQAAAFKFQDREARFNRDLLAAQVAAMPNPADVALAEGFDNFFAFWAGVGGAALGGAGGGSALTTKGNPGLGQSGGPSMYVPQPSGSHYTGSNFSSEFLTGGGGGGGGFGSGAL